MVDLVIWMGWKEGKAEKGRVDWRMGRGGREGKGRERNGKGRSVVKSVADLRRWEELR